MCSEFVIIFKRRLHGPDFHLLTFLKAILNANASPYANIKFHNKYLCLYNVLCPNCVVVRNSPMLLRGRFRQLRYLEAKLKK